MNSKNLNRVVLSFVTFMLVSSTHAFADAARCNDQRKISRDSSEELSTAVCRSPDALSQAEAQVLRDAEAATRDRLGKFDTECKALPGGHVNEVSSQPEARGSIETRYTHFRDCDSDERG